MRFLVPTSPYVPTGFGPRGSGHPFGVGHEPNALPAVRHACPLANAHFLYSPLPQSRCEPFGSERLASVLPAERLVGFPQPLSSDRRPGLEHDGQTEELPQGVVFLPVLGGRRRRTRCECGRRPPGPDRTRRQSSCRLSSAKSWRTDRHAITVLCRTSPHAVSHHPGDDAEATRGASECRRSRGTASRAGGTRAVRAGARVYPVAGAR